MIVTQSICRIGIFNDYCPVELIHINTRQNEHVLSVLRELELLSPPSSPSCIAEK